LAQRPGGHYNGRMPRPITNALLKWYAHHARRLPWRTTSDPYQVWVSEVMLQQTQVDTVIPYYQRWMRTFPTLKSLAGATTEQVLKLWEGLGYYRRGLLMRKAAQQLVESGRESLPATIEELEALPGIGAYTARAVAAIALGKDALALDGNLRRVLARVFDIDLDVRSPEGERKLRQAGESVLPHGQASGFNQALMDLGAMICLPARPRCQACPIARFCAAFQAGVQDARPVKRQRTPKPHQTRLAAVVRHRGRVLVRRRPEGELLGGLWEFPGVEAGLAHRGGEALEEVLEQAVGWRVKVGGRLGEFRHAYTHFSVTVEAFSCLREDPRPHAGPEERWVRPVDLAALPMGKVDRAIADRLIENTGP
jgi:A/G-specific adenine glycosylase